MIDHDVQLGENVHILDPLQVNLFGCTIGDGTFIGPFVEITRGVTVGRDCKIQSHAFVCDGVTLEDGVFVGHGAMFVNDHYPMVERQVERHRTLVCAGASIGSNATVLGGVTIGAKSIVGAGSVVTRDVPPCSIVAGNPARILRQFDSPEELHAYMGSRQPVAAGASPSLLAHSERPAPRSPEKCSS